MNIFQKVAYIFFFWAIFLIVKAITFLFKIIPLKYIVLLANRNNKRILYLDIFFEENAGFYYRTKKWAEIIKTNGYKAVVLNVYNKQRFHKLVYNRDNIIIFQIGFILVRLVHFIYALSFKTVVVRRTILLYNEYGQGTFMEKLLNTIHPNVIIDFDDDMQIQKVQKDSLFGKLLLENKKKFYLTLNVYDRFIVGSEYLKTLVLKYNTRVLNENIIVIPTCVDYEKYPAKQYTNSEIITFGWIGSNANLLYLDDIIAPLNSIAKTHRIKLLIISGINYKNTNAQFEIENVMWSLKDEVTNLLKIDIGLMPLHNTPMEKGKCGFKLIQYMGLGIVSVGRAITANKEIIDDELNGFLVYNDSEWETVLRKVLEKKAEFKKIGEEARKKVNLKYSFNKYLSNDYVNFVTKIHFNVTLKEYIRKVVHLPLYYGYYIFAKRFNEKTVNQNKLKPGITAVVSAKNEETIISLSLKSLLGFADQIVCIDNGSEDKTLELMNEFMANNQHICDIKVLSMPNSLLGECRNAGLRESKHQWHLRWDADMIFKTTGNESSQILRNKILKINKPYAFQLVRTNLFGDFHHTTKLYDVIDSGEPFLVRLNNKIKYIEDDKFDIIKLPPYYKIIKLSDKYIFHCDGIKSDLRLIYRNCYFDWREKYNTLDKNSKKDISVFSKFEEKWLIKKYQTNDVNSLIYRHQKETLPYLKKYDVEIYGEYPEIILEQIKKNKERFKILYKKGRPYIRTDSHNPAIQNYIPTEADLNYNPLDYLKKVLPEISIYKLQ